MRKYVFGTGLVSALATGMTLLRGARGDVPFTWRQALAWLSWGITMALVVGTIMDTYRAGRGAVVATDSPVSGHEQKLLEKHLKR